MGKRRIGAFNRNAYIKPNLDPFVYAKALTGDDEKARELLAIMKLLKEIGLTITPAFDDERKLVTPSDKRYS